MISSEKTNILQTISRDTKRHRAIDTLRSIDRLTERVYREKQMNGRERMKGEVRIKILKITYYKSLKGLGKCNLHASRDE